MICVIGNSTIFLLVASFVLEKNKRYSYDAGYKLKVITYAEEHGNRAAERHFGPPSTEKTIRDWRASKELTKKKFLVYKTELTFKTSENSNFFQLFFTSPPITDGFSVGGGPKCRSAALFPCYYAYGITFNL